MSDLLVSEVVVVTSAYGEVSVREPSLSSWLKILAEIPTIYDSIKQVSSAGKSASQMSATLKLISENRKVEDVFYLAASELLSKPLEDVKANPPSGSDCIKLISAAKKVIDWEGLKEAFLDLGVDLSSFTPNVSKTKAE